MTWKKGRKDDTENEKEVEDIEGLLEERAILIGQEEEEEMDNEATSTPKEAEPEPEEERMGRGRRIKKPNPNVVGPQYANAIMTRGGGAGETYRIPPYKAP
ncbi:hypothetical protein CLOP_g13910 [Closterium sp. NIES-67]|nr:hypothetical protein CLOP_g13910 [Closterium sp. NIES-67]